MFSLKKDNDKDDSYYMLFTSCILSIFALFVLIYLVIVVFTFDVEANSFINITFFTLLLSLIILIGFLAMPLIYYSVNTSSKTIHSDTFRMPTNIFIDIGVITCLVTFSLSIIIAMLH
jgi:hypothetical protein